MMKSTVIFSDEDQEKKKENNFRSSRQESIRLSRDEYRQLIKDAYHEGREDAFKESEKRTTPQQGKGAENQKLTRDGTKDFAIQKNAKRQHFKEARIPEQKESLEMEGKEEAMREHAKQEQENLQRFKTITARHEIEIMRTKSVWPFTLFQDTLVIDTTKVTIARKQLFATEFVATIPLKDLADVNIQTVFFLGTVMIKYMPQSDSPGMTQPVEVRIANLKREDAVRAKNILKGALVSKAEEIDIAKLPPDEVVKVLEKFGGNKGIV